MGFLQKEDRILEEIRGVLRANPEESEKALVRALLGAERVFVFGQGRSGLIGKGFAMRLAQLNLKAFVVEESTTPAISKKDILVAISGSGETRTVVDIASEARGYGAKVACLTAKKSSPLAKKSSLVIALRAKTKKGGKSIEPLGSLFEQSALIFLDAVVLGIMKKLGVGEKEMAKRHSVLE